MNQSNQSNPLRLDCVETPNIYVENSAENLQKETQPSKESRNTWIVEHLVNSFEATKFVINSTNYLGNKHCHSLGKRQKMNKSNEQKRKRNSAGSGRESTKKGCISGSSTELHKKDNCHSNEENEELLKHDANTLIHQSNFKCDTISTLCPYMSFETASYSDAIGNINNFETEETERETDNKKNNNNLYRRTNRSTKKYIKKKCMNEQFNKEYFKNSYNENFEEDLNKKEETFDSRQDHSFLVSATEDSVQKKEEADTDVDATTDDECPLLDIDERLVDEILKSQDIKIVRKTKVYKKKSTSSRKKGRIYQVRVRGKKCWRAEWYDPQQVVLKDSEELDEKGNIIKKSNSEKKNDANTENEENGTVENTRIEEYYIKRSKQYSVSVYTPEVARTLAITSLLMHEAIPNNGLKEQARKVMFCLKDLKKKSKTGKAREEIRKIAYYLEFKRNCMLNGSNSSSEQSNSPMKFEDYYNSQIKKKGSSRRKRKSGKNKKGASGSKRKPRVLSYLNMKNKNIVSAIEEYGNTDPDSKKLNQTMSESRISQRNNNHFTSENCANDSDEMNKDLYNNSYIQNFMYNAENPLIQRQQNFMDCFSSGQMHDNQIVSFDGNYQNTVQEDASYYRNQNMQHTVTNDTTSDNSSIVPYMNNLFLQNTPYDLQNTNRESFGSPLYMGNHIDTLHELGNIHFMLNQNNVNPDYPNYTIPMSNPYNPTFSDMLNMNFQNNTETNSGLRRLNPDFPLDAYPTDNETNYPLHRFIHNQPMEMNSVYGQCTQNENPFLNQSPYIHYNDGNYFIQNNQNQNWLPPANAPYTNDTSSLNEIVQNHTNSSKEINHNNNNSAYTNNYFQE